MTAEDLPIAARSRGSLIAEVLSLRAGVVERDARIKERDELLWKAVETIDRSGKALDEANECVLRLEAELNGPKTVRSGER